MAAADADVSHWVRLGAAVEDGGLDVLFDHQAEPETAAMAAVSTRDRERFDAHWAKVVWTRRRPRRTFWPTRRRWRHQ